MSRLLSAGFTRLWKNALFWAGIFLTAGFMIFVMLLNYRDMAKYDIHYTVDTFFSGYFMFVGVFTAIFTPLFLGTEYSDGVIRNKLVIGHSRIHIYLSSLIVCFVSTVLLCAACALAALALGVPLFGSPTIPLPQLMAYIGMGIMEVAAFSGIFTMITMLCPNKSASATLCTIGFFVMLFAAIYVMNRLEAPEFLEGYELAADGSIVQTEPYPNPHYLQSTARAVFTFLQDFLPTGQGFQLAAQHTAPRLLLPLYSLLITAGTTLAGILAFRKKDLK